MEVTVRTLVLALACTLVAGHAHAISRYNSQSMSCAEVQAVLQNERTAILTYSSARTGVPLYGRYVYSDASCAIGQCAERKYVSTADNASCPVKECIYDEDTSSR
jgi:hypothetical protein